MDSCSQVGTACPHLFWVASHELLTLFRGAPMTETNWVLVSWALTLLRLEDVICA